jgi:hypothetical protein
MPNDNSIEKQQHTQQLAQHLFCTNAAYKSLSKPVRHKKLDKVAVIFNDVVQLAKGNTQAAFIEYTPLLIKKINSDISLRRIYSQLVKQLKFSESGLQAFASSGDTLTTRSTEHFSLQFKRDKSQPKQIYVILKVAHPAEHHLQKTIAMHIESNDHIDCLYFPFLKDGRSQLLMDEDDAHFKLLSDGNSHLYLM